MATRKQYKQKKMCLICKKRHIQTRHSKSYNHALGDFVELCHPCHSALHLSNQNNFFDWEYLMKNKKEIILKEAEKIDKRMKVPNRGWRKRI